MNAFLYEIYVQWRMSLRNKELFVVYYIVPLVFFLFMGAIFTAIMPDAYQSLIASMTVFGVSMGGILGSPSTLHELYHTEVKKVYLVSDVPIWSGALTTFISGMLHLFIMSMIIFGFAPILFHATIPSNIPLYLLGLVLLISCSLGIGTLFGLFVRHVNQLNMVTQIVFLPSILLSGIMFPSTLLPKALILLGKLCPATWAYQLMNQTGNTLTCSLILSGLLILILLVCGWKLTTFSIK